jgi:hypothetical protein
MDTAKVQNLTVRIEQDTDRQETSRDWDNLGTMYCWHNRYRLGDENPYKTPEAFFESEEYKQAVTVLPLGLYDHSGISMYVGTGSHPFDAGGWDSGQVGVIFVTRARVLSEYSAKRITKNLLAKVREVLAGEVKTYDQDLTGDVYGYIVEDENGQHIDSCWGFYGAKEALQEGKSAAQSYLDNEKEQEKMVRNTFAL